MSSYKSLLLLFIVVISSCSPKKDEQKNDKSTLVTTSVINEDEFVLRLNMLVLNNLTIPVSVIEDLKKEEGESVYHAEYINDLDNVSKYDTKFSQALNFGIYGLDIIYNTAHDHVLDIKKYKEKTLPMAKSLGVESFYTESDMDKFLNYAASHKSLNQFIIDEYHRIDEYLISNQNYKTAVLALTGGALEGMYFTGKSIEDSGVSDLKYSLLINEKHLINQIVPLYDYFSGDDKMLSLKKNLIVIQKDLNSFTSRGELTDEVARTLDNDIIVLRNKIVENKM